MDVLEEDEEALGKVLLVTMSACTIYILPLCYVRYSYYGLD